MRFVVEGKPVGKGRPRLARYAVYTPNKTVNYEYLVKFSYLQITNKKIEDGSIKIEIWAYFEPNKSESQKRQKELIGKPYCKKPDIDNIAKSILDGLNGIAYRDDNQITELYVHKLYDTHARTEIEIVEVL